MNWFHKWTTLELSLPSRNIVTTVEEYCYCKAMFLSYDRYQETTSVRTKPRSRRRRADNQEHNCCITLTIRRNRRSMPIPQIQREVHLEFKILSTLVRWSRVQEFLGWNASRFCRHHWSWENLSLPKVFCNYVIFSDVLSIVRYDHRIHVLKKTNQFSEAPSCFKQKFFNGLTELVTFESTMSGEKCIREVIQTHAKLRRGFVGYVRW